MFHQETSVRAVVPKLHSFETTSLYPCISLCEYDLFCARKEALVSQNFQNQQSVSLVVNFGHN